MSPQRKSTIDLLNLGDAVRELAEAGASSREIAERLAEAGVELAARTVRDWLARDLRTLDTTAPLETDP